MQPSYDSYSCFYLYSLWTPYMLYALKTSFCQKAILFKRTVGMDFNGDGSSICNSSYLLSYYAIQRGLLHLRWNRCFFFFLTVLLFWQCLTSETNSSNPNKIGRNLDQLHRSWEVILAAFISSTSYSKI